MLSNHQVETCTTQVAIMMKAEANSGGEPRIWPMKPPGTEPGMPGSHISARVTV